MNADIFFFVFVNRSGYFYFVKKTKQCNYEYETCYGLKSLLAHDDNCFR